MWQKLKELFQSTGGPPVIIQPVSYEDGLLCFKAEKPLKLTRSTVAAPSKVGHFGLQIDILSHDEASGIYRGKVLENETFALDAMKIERRREFRLEISLPVISEEIAGKKAKTEDISLNGARILMDGPLTVGDHIGVKIHFNDVTVSTLDLRGQVQWCAPTRKGKYHCGIRFFMIEKAEKVKIKRFIENRVAMGGH